VSEAARKARIVAAVHVAQPPAGLTPDEWIAWRQQEDQRMREELMAQLDALGELASGATVH
jgi:hypothetical protein